MHRFIVLLVFLSNFVFAGKDKIVQIVTKPEIILSHNKSEIDYGEKLRLFRERQNQTIKTDSPPKAEGQAQQASPPETDPEDFGPVKKSKTKADKQSRTEELLKKFESNPQNVKYSDLEKVCDAVFGGARQHGSSHRVYKTPWQGDPRVNIQNENGKAKPYQVRQVLKAVKKMKEEGHAWQM